VTRLLALDVGATVGYARGQLGDEPVHRTFRLQTSSVRDLLGARLDRFEEWLTDAFRAFGITMVVMAERFHVRNTGEAAMSFGLDGIVRMVAYRHQARVLVQPEGTVRKEMLGRGSGPSDVMKQLAIDWCERHGYRVESHHEADSLVLWTWTERELFHRSVTPSAVAPRRTPRSARSPAAAGTPG
jgi:hypothetical protein